MYIWVTISSVHLLSHFVTFYHISSHCVLSYIQLQWKVLLLVLLLVMDSICGGGEHWAKPKENQRKETVIDFHLYVGHREPIKYEILYVGSYSWKCTKYRVVSLTGQKETWYISAAPLLECYIAQSAMFPLWDTQLYKQLNWYLGLPFFSSLTPVKCFTALSHLPHCALHYGWACARPRGAFWKLGKRYWKLGIFEPTKLNILNAISAIL